MNYFILCITFLYYYEADSSIYQTQRSFVKSFGPLISKDTDFSAYHQHTKLFGFTDSIIAPDNGWNGIKVRLLASKDLDAAADLGLDCFFVPRFQVNDNGLNSWERSILCSVASGLTAVEKGDAWLSNKFGFYNRAGKRLKDHNWLASDDSLIIVAVTSNITNTNVDQEKLVGLIELCLDKPNGLLSPPFRPVDFFGLLPTGKVNKGSTYAPYLCNLSVAKEFRRKGLGKMLCQVSERVAKDMWGYKDMYLHVQEENVAAQKLYESMGYVRKNVLTKRQIEDEDMEKIRYYWKDLNATDSQVDQITP